jgi:hypothetical protein
MSTWISSARCTLALIPILLSACVAGDMLPSGGGVSRVAVSDGAVVIAGPPGYCIDREATRTGEGNAFVLLGSCAALGGGQAPAAQAVLTASVLAGAPTSQPLVAAFPEMAAFFRSPAGRAALSRSGQAADVTVRQVETVKDVMVLRLRDTSASSGASVEPDYWRAVFSVRGRIVSLSVLAMKAQPLSAAGQRRLLDAFVARVRRENRVAPGT